MAKLFTGNALETVATEEWHSTQPDGDGTTVPGAKGDKGDPGPPGAKGDKGDDGQPGAKGDKGDDGQPGAKGDKGDDGQPGAKGDKGDQGLPGAKGDKGDDGQPGAKGDKGDQGLPGAKGDKGDDGQPGAKGDKGDDGQPGAKGDKGDQGETGLPGIVSSQTIPSNGNLNNYRTAGFYHHYANPVHSIANVPGMAYSPSFTLFVESCGTELQYTCTQTITLLVNPIQKFVRNCINNSWGQWEELAKVISGTGTGTGLPTGTGSMLSMSLGQPLEMGPDDPPNGEWTVYGPDPEDYESTLIQDWDVEALQYVQRKEEQVDE
jgi:hypothetical protein